MAHVAIQLSDEDLERLKAHAEARHISPEQAAAEAVKDLLGDSAPWRDPATEADYRAFVQVGIDEADRGETEDWDVVKTGLRAHMTERLAASSK